MTEDTPRDDADQASVDAPDFEPTGPGNFGDEAAQHLGAAQHQAAQEMAHAEGDGHEPADYEDAGEHPAEAPDGEPEPAPAPEPEPEPEPDPPGVA